MKKALSICGILLSGGCIGFAAYLCWHGSDDWGWFLFIGFILFLYIVPEDKIVVHNDKEEQQDGD